MQFQTPATPASSSTSTSAATSGASALRQAILAGGHMRKHPVGNCMRTAPVDYVVANLNGLDFKIGNNDVGIWLLSLKELRANLASHRKKLERLGVVMSSSRRSGAGTSSSASSLDVASKKVGTVTRLPPAGAATAAATPSAPVKRLMVLLLFDDPLCVGRSLEALLQDFTMEVIFSDFSLYCARSPLEAALAIEDLFSVHRKPRSFLRGYRQAAAGNGRAAILGKSGKQTETETNREKSNSRNRIQGNEPNFAHGNQHVTPSASSAAVSTSMSGGGGTMPTQSIGTTSTGNAAARIPVIQHHQDSGSSSTTILSPGSAGPTAPVPGADDDQEENEEAFFCRETALGILMQCRDVSRMDAETVLDHFKSLANVVQAPQADLLRVPNWTDRKVRNFYELFHSQIFAF
ncbi:unnamed protein product [Amoebophrya sp. A25]|nr:unnamed protein product [Amoebophrya sp. A25]|eukprot:GSA25T00013813001.1